VKGRITKVGPFAVELELKVVSSTGERTECIEVPSNLIRKCRRVVPSIPRNPNQAP